jgi:hypothetical protein
VIKELQGVGVVGGMVCISTRAAWRQDMGETMKSLEFFKTES